MIKNKKKEMAKTNPLLVTKELAARHCMGAVGTKEGKDEPRFNITCVYYGIRPTAVLHYATKQQLQAVDELGLSVLPILEQIPTKDQSSNSFVVYNASNSRSVLLAKLLSILSTNDSRAYSPTQKKFYAYGSPCKKLETDKGSTFRCSWRPCKRVIGKTNSGGLVCPENKNTLAREEDLLTLPLMVGSALGYDPEAVKTYALELCGLRKNPPAQCMKQFEREKHQIERLMSPSSEEHQGFVEAIEKYMKDMR